MSRREEIRARSVCVCGGGGGMCAYHGADITTPPPPKVLVVVVGVLARVPAVKRFLHEHHTELVARSNKRLRHGVVGRSNRVVSVGLERLDTPLVCTVDDLAAECAVVVVNAAALEFHRHAVELKSTGGCERRVSHAKVRGDGVGPTVARHVDGRGVQVRAEVGVGLVGWMWVGE
jgi:hypothetical protein